MEIEMDLTHSQTTNIINPLILINLEILCSVKATYHNSFFYREWIKK